MEGLNFLLSNISILENPKELKAYMDPKDEDGNSDEVTKQNNHRSLALLIRDLIDNFSNNESIRNCNFIFFSTNFQDFFIFINSIVIF